LSHPIWWTEADQAELDAALWEMVCALDGLEDKEARGRIIDLVLEWRERRMLLSKAEWFRRRHVEAMLA